MASTQTPKSNGPPNSLSDLTKIPEKEFQQEFRSWMERDDVARSLQTKLRCDLIANFNKTTLGKRIIGEATTNRMTLSPVVFALNTLVAEFLYAQDCHFTLSVFCTEVPYRNALPDFDNIRNFRFKQSEITEILKAICSVAQIDWNLNNDVVKNYEANASTSLLYHILIAIINKFNESIQKKVSIGTNTRPVCSSMSPMDQSSNYSSSMLQCQRQSKSDIHNLSFRYLQHYLLILSKKVKEMSNKFEEIRSLKDNSINRPRVRILTPPRRRKYKDLNRSLDRATKNLKQMTSSRKKNKNVDTIITAIEALGKQFQKCSSSFENVSKDLMPAFRRNESQQAERSISTESVQTTTRPTTTSTTSAASQTKLAERTYSDWLHEMRYTRNGQKFLDRVEKSLRKALDKQKQDLIAENEVRLRHQRELLRIRYKQQLIEQTFSKHENDLDDSSDEKLPQETISEQLRKFEQKHVELLSKIYGVENDNESSAPPPILNGNPQNSTAPKTEEGKDFVDIISLDLKNTSSSDCIDQQHNLRLPFDSVNSLDLKQHLRDAVEEMVEEERKVNKIVHDAKVRIQELERESNELTEHFLGYMERQHQQKLDARDAAQGLWTEYVTERDKLQDVYINTNYNNSNSGAENTKKLEKMEIPILNKESLQLNKDKEVNLESENASNSSSSSSSPSVLNSPFTNPIHKAKEEFFERERKFKEETERAMPHHHRYVPSNEPQSLDPEIFTRSKTSNVKDDPFRISFYEPVKGTSSSALRKLSKRKLLANGIMSQLLNESLSGSSAELSPRSTTTTAATATTTTTTNTTKITTTNSDTSAFNRILSQSKSQRHEASATIKEIITPTTSGKLFNTHNVNKDDVEGHCGFGASSEEISKITSSHNGDESKSYCGQKNVAQNAESSKSNNTELNNNNNEHNNKNTKITDNLDFLPEAIQRLRKRTENRKIVIKESMAKMQRLFAPIQEQPKLQKPIKKPKIMLDDVAEDVEESDELSDEKKCIEATNKSNNQLKNVVAVGDSSRNVSYHYENNSQSQQASTASAAAAVAPPTPTTRTIRTQTIAQQQHRTPLKKKNGAIDGGVADSNAITITANNRKQEKATKSSNGSNKAIEVMPDWQPIGYSSTRIKNVLKKEYEQDEIEKGKVKAAKSTNVIEANEVVIEGMTMNSNAVESGEVTEDEHFVAAGSSSFKVPKAKNELETGERIVLLDSGGIARGVDITAISSSSLSTEPSLSLGGGGDGAALLETGGLRAHLSQLEACSDSGSDFWA